jgi:HK97 family phage prohead protease
LAEHKESDSLPQMFWMHNPSLVPGKWTEMREDSKGLVVKGVLADTDLGNEIHTLLKMDAVRGLSIGYRTIDQDFDKDGNRLIKEAELWEVSVVSLPMNPKAQVAHVKSRLSAKGEYVPTDSEIAELKRDTERFLRGKGLSRKLSMSYAASAVENLFDDSATLASEEDPSATLVQKSSATPDEIEINTGLTDFMNRQIIYDLEKRLAKLRA